MIGFIIWLIILLLVFGIIVWAVDQIAILDSTIKSTVKAMVAMLLVLILLGAALGLVPVPTLRGLP